MGELNETIEMMIKLKLNESVLIKVDNGAAPLLSYESLV